jgi:dTMP kinase
MGVGASRSASITRIFGSRIYFRLWCSQVVSSLGDWLGLIAVTAIAARVGGDAGAGAAVGLVLSARVVPGLFLGSFMGVAADRWDRKRTMVCCDAGRGLVLLWLPFIKDVPSLILASFVLELFTLLWSSAKEATVPNLVERSFLPSANSLSVAAAYGTFPVSSAVFAGLVGLAGSFGKTFGVHSLGPETLAIWFDVLTFWISATTIATLAIPRRPVAASGVAADKVDVGRIFRDLREGFQYIGQNGTVRAVLLGLACGLAGGGMVVPLGPVFSNDVLHAGPSGFGVLLTVFGLGVASGVLGISVLQRRIPHAGAFQAAVLSAGAMLVVTACMWRLPLAGLAIAAFGICTGAAYVMGFSLLGSEVSDDLRGRTFATLYTSTRLCLFLALVVSPFIGSALDGLSRELIDRQVRLAGVTVHLPGVRLTLWLGGLVIIGAGLLTRSAMRSTTRQPVELAEETAA